MNAKSFSEDKSVSAKHFIAPRRLSASHSVYAAAGKNIPRRQCYGGNFAEPDRLIRAEKTGDFSKIYFDLDANGEFSRECAKTFNMDSFAAIVRRTCLEIFRKFKESSLGRYGKNRASKQFCCILDSSAHLVVNVSQSIRIGILRLESAA